MQKTLCFDDVLLVPQYSEIETRSKVDLSVPGIEGEIARLTPSHPMLTCPVIGSPMDTIMSTQAAVSLAEMGGFGVFHRYCTIDEARKMYVEFVNSMPSHFASYEFPHVNRHNAMCAIGATGDYLERATALYEAGCRAFCIDVAHGYHVSVKNALKEMRSKFGNEIHIMTGNVATLEAFNDLADWGSSSIRVGVGGGSMCSTRIRTGHGIPTLQSVIDCARSDRDAYIVADGGIRNSGDAVKALAAGADMIMLGSILAGHEECPGDLIDEKGLTYQSEMKPIGVKLYKKFRGMASREAQLQWRGRVSVVEGESTTVAYRGSMKNTVTDLLEGIRSGLSYSGANTIREFRRKAKFVVVTPQGVQENVPHGK